MTKKLKKSKIAAVFALVSTLLLLPGITKAEAGSLLGGIIGIGGIAYAAIGSVAFATSWLIATVGGMAITIESWVLGFVLNINSGIINSPPVRVGFPITLSLANLALVFAIIVIAIMTILRQETYGIKQVLWKLIVIAVAINFGLVIAGVILQFFDSLGSYFLNSINPASGGYGTNLISQFNPFSGFASALAGAFNPQRSIVSGNPDAGLIAGYKNEVQSIGEGIGGLIRPITAVLFTVFSLLFIIITLGVLIAMLVIRYVYLGYLLILLPFAWVSWIFPATINHWSKWWHNFFNQAAFAPIVLFFMWVAIQSSYAMNAGAGFDFGPEYTSDSNSAFAAISKFLGQAFTPVIAQLLQLTVLLGITIGGLFAAKSMGIKFADAATGAATGAAKAFGGWAAGKGAGAAARTAARAMQPPRTAQGPAGWRRYNPLSWAAYGATRATQATIGRVAQKTEVGRRATAALQTFGERVAESPGMVASIWKGMRDGSGLFKKVKKVRGRTAGGEVVEIELPESEGAAGGGTPRAPQGPGGAPAPRPQIVIPAGVTGSGRILDEQTGEMVAPEELEQRQEQMERAAFE